jgi:hypothetical protein
MEKTELPHDLAIPPLRQHLKESKAAYNYNTCTPSWNQPRCQSLDELKKVSIFPLFSPLIFIKKNSITSFAGK